jgi:competence protein ComEC
MSGANIVFTAALSFLLGIAAADTGWNIYSLVGAILFLEISAIAATRRLSLGKILSFFLFFVLFGFFYYNFYINFETARENVVFNQRISFSGVVLDEPHVFDKYQTLSVRLDPPLSGDVYVYTSDLAEINYGDRLKIDGKINPPVSEAEKPSSFFPKLEILERHRGFWLKEKLLGMKKFLVGQFGRVLGSNEAALLAGITFGVRSNFSPELKNQMALSGTTHLVALSGYNISVLVIAAANVFGYFFSRRKTFYLTGILIVLFVLMVGGEASVMRAAVMGFLALLAKEAGRIYSMRNSIALTAAAMVFLNPTILIHSVGLQLSFASLLGIVYLGPALKSIVKLKNGGFANWKENAIVTLSAQLAVVPIIIQVFGSFSPTAILANILILEFIPLTMFLGFLLTGVGSLYVYFGFLIAKLVNVLLLYEILVIKFFASVRLPVAASVFESQMTTVLYYGAMATFIYYYSYRKNNGAQKIL